MNLYIAPILLYLLIGISIFYSEDLEFKYLENRASLFVFPLIFITLKLNDITFKKVLNYFILGCGVAVFIYYCYAFYNSLNIIDERIVFQPVVNNEFSFFYSVVRDGNYFFSSFFSIFHDTIYFSLYMNTAVLAILTGDFLKKSIWYYVALFVFILCIFQLSSKVGIVICFLILGLYLYGKLKSNIHRIAAPLLIMLFGILFFAQNPRGKVMINKFKTEGLSINPNERFGYPLRLMSWDAAFDIIKEKPILGVGVKNAQKVLNQRYKQKGYETPYKQELNVHNAFMQIFLE